MSFYVLHFSLVIYYWNTVHSVAWTKKKKTFSLLTQQQDRPIYKLKKEVIYNTIDYIFDPHFSGIAISKMENYRNLHLCFHGFIPLIKLSSSETPTHFYKCEAFGNSWDSWQVKLQNN